MMNVALADPKLKARLSDVGVELMLMTPAEFKKFFAAETEKWAEVIKSAGINLD
jgi:tripartite-type tricarboxylate transporter receptor subunit TctC